MKVWTGRYQNPNVASMDAVKIRITRYPARWGLKYKLDDHIPELAPTAALFKINDRRVFEPLYFAHLDALGIDWVLNRIAQTSQASGNKDAVLLCFCRVNTGDWCHRLVLADWVKQKCGEIWDEVAEPAAMDQKR